MVLIRTVRIIALFAAGVTITLVVAVALLLAGRTPAEDITAEQLVKPWDW